MLRAGVQRERLGLRVCVCWGGGCLVDLLAAQSERVQQVSAGGAAVLREERHQLPVEQRQQSLVARGPHPVPRPVEGIGHGRTQHVVQVDLRRQAKDLQEDEVVEEQDAVGEQRPPHVPQRLGPVRTSFPQQVKRHQVHHGVLDVVDLLLEGQQPGVYYGEH